MIPHNRPTITDADKTAVQRVMDSGFIGSGPEVEALEREWAERFGDGKQEAAAVSSGTAALYLTLATAGIWANDTVLLPTYCCSALWQAVAHTGAVPVLADVTEDGNLDWSYRNVRTDACRAVIAVHTYGRRLLIPDQKRFVLADSSHYAAPYGTPYQGDAVVWSLGPTKLIGAAGGGIILGSPDLIRAIKDRRDVDGKDDLRPRFNFLMSDLSAAIARMRLADLGSMVSRREAISEAYDATRLIGRAYKFPHELPSWYRYVVRVASPDTTISTIWKDYSIEAINPLRRDELLHIQSGKRGFPVAERLAASTVSLPIYPSMTDDEIETVCEALTGIEVAA